MQLRWNVRRFLDFRVTTYTYVEKKIINTHPPFLVDRKRTLKTKKNRLQMICILRAKRVDLEPGTEAGTRGVGGTYPWRRTAGYVEIKDEPLSAGEEDLRTAKTTDETRPDETEETRLAPSDVEGPLYARCRGPWTPNGRQTSPQTGDRTCGMAFSSRPFFSDADVDGFSEEETGTTAEAVYAELMAENPTTTRRPSDVLLGYGVEDADLSSDGPGGGDGGRRLRRKLRLRRKRRLCERGDSRKKDEMT